MASRKLGGGRILGSGRGLAASHQNKQISTSLLQPSPVVPSEVSSQSHGSPAVFGMHSVSSPSPLPDSSQDLTANISLAAPSFRDRGQLLCPICGEEMVTLLQLNRHIDDVHQELPETQQDEVKTWFDKQVIKAKKFQPLSIINQKLRGIEAFESNESGPPQLSQIAVHGSLSKPASELTFEPDELFTRKHWQRPTGHDVCTDPTCAKVLGTINGSINCRSCGKLFCEAHTMYQMKLSRSANYEPIGGYWARVCETCYKSRPGYNNHHGFESDLTDGFLSLRKKLIERQNLETARLEKRLTRLTQLLVDPSAELVAAAGAGGGSGAPSLLTPVSTLSGQKSLRRAIEQSVVTWEDDSSVSRCPLCQQDFSSWSFRKHHCRICGRVVCADPLTGCSSEVGLGIAARTGNGSTTAFSSATAIPFEKDQRQGREKINIDVRMCRDCKSTIFSKRDFAATVAHRPADQRAYETLRQFEWGIRQMMPIFQRSLQALQADGQGLNNMAVTHAQIQEAAKVRKRLMGSFTKYNLAATRLRDLKTDSLTQKRLQKSIFVTASTFLQANMVPLKHVPAMLRSHKSSTISPSNHRRLLANLTSGGPTPPLRNGELIGDDGDSASVTGSEASTAVMGLETEEKELREKLVVLEEQRFLVQQMIDNARGSRRFEEIGALGRNAEELDQEISRLKLQVSNVEERWEGLYAASTGS